MAARTLQAYSVGHSFLVIIIIISEDDIIIIIIINTVSLSSSLSTSSLRVVGL